MKNNNISINAIFDAIFLLVLIAFCIFLELEVCKKNERIQELENKVEEQYYLIDALIQ